MSLIPLVRLAGDPCYPLPLGHSHYWVDQAFLGAVHKLHRRVRRKWPPRTSRQRGGWLKGAREPAAGKAQDAQSSG